VTLVLVRIDDRLLHGQVTHGWLPAVQPDVILVADETASREVWQREAVEASSPDGTEVRVLDVEAAARVLRSDTFSGRRVVLLVRGPEVLLTLVRAGVVIGVANVGGMHAGPGRIPVREDFQLTIEEARAFEALDRAGVSCAFRALPSDAPIVVPSVTELLELGGRQGE
jgi:mannose/fructose/N-acetylgalactosamine-specific phosphotransferase system component IIB